MHKNKTKNSLLLALMAACCLIASACSDSYETGDKYNTSDYEGIVVQVDDEGNPLMIISMVEASNINADSAARWAEGLNEGKENSQWHLPSAEEMTVVKRAKAMINKSLENKKMSPILENHTFARERLRSARHNMLLPIKCLAVL